MTTFSMDSQIESNEVEIENLEERDPSMISFSANSHSANIIFVAAWATDE